MAKKFDTLEFISSGGDRGAINRAPAAAILYVLESDIADLKQRLERKEAEAQSIRDRFSLK